jgi:tetratricopeptide (TPR) repeat protein
VAATARIRRKDLRRPDEFVTLTVKSVRYAQAHSRELGWVIGAAAVVALGAIVLLSMRSADTDRARAEFARAWTAFNERQFAEALPLLERYEREHGSSQRVPATLLIGYAHLEQGNFDAAAAAFQQALPLATEPDAKQQAHLGLAYAREGKRDHAAAAAAFAAAAAADGPYGAVAALGEARNKESAGDVAGAREAYRAFVEKYPDASEHPFVEDRLATRR